MKTLLSLVDKKRFSYTTENQKLRRIAQTTTWSNEKNEGTVDETFYPQVIEREQLSSTAFGSGVAIPYSLTMNANRTGLRCRQSKGDPVGK